MMSPRASAKDTPSGLIAMATRPYLVSELRDAGKSTKRGGWPCRGPKRWGPRQPPPEEDASGGVAVPGTQEVGPQAATPKRGGIQGIYYTIETR